MTPEDVHAVTRAHVPLADRLVGAARHRVVLRDGDAVDVIVVSAQDADALDAGGACRPQARRVVLAAGRQHRAVVAERDAVDARFVLVERLQEVGLVAGGARLPRATHTSHRRRLAPRRSRGPLRDAAWPDGER